jgi:hypothetical protein
MKVMFETATVTTRPPACGVADIFPAEPISDMIQPPQNVCRLRYGGAI